MASFCLTHVEHVYSPEIDLALARAALLFGAADASVQSRQTGHLLLLSAIAWLFLLCAGGARLSSATTNHYLHDDACHGSVE